MSGGLIECQCVCEWCSGRDVRHSWTLETGRFAARRAAMVIRHEKHAYSYIEISLLCHITELGTHSSPRWLQLQCPAGCWLLT